MASLLNWDVTFFYWINRGHQNAFFDRVMPYITEFDHWKFWFLAAWLIWFVLGGKQTRITLVLLVLLVGLLDTSNSFFFKHLFARLRPCNVLSEVRVFWPCPRSFSFPSNHAANVFGGAFFLSYIYRRWAFGLIFIALLVGYSRVYVGEHFPLDVVVGAALGAIGAGGMLVLRYQILRWWQAGKSSADQTGRPIDPRRG
jgi:undecaprenyl-diphosphatase